jgi:hypothetical protein
MAMLCRACHEDRKFTNEILPHTNQIDSSNCGVFVCIFYQKLLQKQKLEIPSITTSRIDIFNKLISKSKEPTLI